MAAALSIPTVGMVRTATGTTPRAVDWSALVGDTVELVGDGVRFVAQVVDVRDITPAVDDAAVGRAHSILLDIPDTAHDGSHIVDARGPDGSTTRLTILPVGQRSSWEAVIDRRQPAHD